MRIRSYPAICFCMLAYLLVSLIGGGVAKGNELAQSVSGEAIPMEVIMRAIPISNIKETPEIKLENVPGTEAADDDFGAAPAKKDDDFGVEPEMKDDDFGSDSQSEDDDFGADPAMADDDFGSDLFPKGAKDAKVEMKFDSPEAGTPKKKKSDKKYASAADAHLTFLKALETEKRYPSAVTCAECHPDHYREWSVSAHSYAQMSPVFNTMHAAITSRTSGTNGDFCIRCHTQVGMQRDEPLFTSNLKRHPASVEGITCIVCHRVEQNYGKVSGRTHIEQGSIFEPVYGPSGSKILDETLQRKDLAKKLNAEPPVEGEKKRVGKKAIHGEVVKFDPITTSGFCGTCHDVNLYNGFRLEEAFTQYKNSPAAAKGETCQDCHMGKIPGAVAPGISKAASPERFDSKNYSHGPGSRISGDLFAVEGDDATGQYGIATTSRKRTNHMFAGPDYSIVHPGIFPHSKDLRQAMWEFDREVPGTDKFERVGMEQLLEFRWEYGWGDPESSFEKSVIKSPEKEKSLPWPWDDLIARVTMREQLNNSFRLLNDINIQRHQVLRRALQFGDFKVSKNSASGIEFSLEVRNATDGHAVPTGFDAERLMFLQATVRDRKGRIIFESGDRDPNGDVRDLHSVFVHHHAEKSEASKAKTAWKEGLGIKRKKEDEKWLLDKYLFSLQSKFLTRNHRGGEREQILAVNYSVDPLPYIRPDTRPGILSGRPAGARKQSRGIPPLGSRTAKYKVSKDQLSGDGPYTVEFNFVCQMVPNNLINEISDMGFDYNLSPREVGKRVAYGHPVTGSKRDEDRRGGALSIWNKTLPLSEAPYKANLKPSESEIMASPRAPFPYKDPATFGGIGGIGGGIEGIDLGPIVLPGEEEEKSELPKTSEGDEDDSFE